MSNRVFVENIAGFLVLGLAAYVLSLVFLHGDLKYRADQYVVKGVFDSAAGLSVGSDIRISGVPVGSVTGVQLDEAHKAEVSMNLFKDTKIPEDSSAAILSDGLFGSKYISVTVGISDVPLEAGDYFMYTQSFNLSLEHLVGRLLFGIDANAKNSH